MNEAEKRFVDRHIGPEMTAFSIRIPAKHLEALAVKAKAAQRTKGSIVREAVAIWLRAKGGQK